MDTRYGKLPLICCKISLSFSYILKKGSFPDLLATSGDYLRVWQINDHGTRLECLLNNVRLMSKISIDWIISI